MNTVVLFTLRFLAAEALLTAVQYPLRKKKLKPAARVGVIVGKALLAIVFAVLVLAGPVQLRSVQPILTALYVALLADAAADALCSVIFAVSKKKRRFPAVKAVSLAFGAAFLAFGVVNMLTVKPAYHTYASPEIKQEHTVVFIADLHVGGPQPFSVTEKTVAAARALRADATVLGGDIVDDYTSKEDMEAVCRLFGAFETPVYFIYGNHDRQGHAKYAGGRKFTPEELEAAMEANGVTVLKDEYAVIAPDLVLLGREDVSEGEKRAQAASLVSGNPSPQSYLIVADHQPTQFKENAAAGADLQLSGHTHAGQLFPLGLLYRVIGYCYGDYTQDGAVMNVSAGAAGWRFPLRTQAGCHFEVIRLTPEK